MALRGAMALRNEVIQRVAQANCLQKEPGGWCNADGVSKHPECALAAAFAALPECIAKNPPEPIVVGRHPHWFQGFDDCLAYLARVFGK